MPAECNDGISNVGGAEPSMLTEVVQALLHTRGILDELGVPCAVMGGLAVSACDHVRATVEVEILIGIRSTSPDDLLKEFQARGYRPKVVPALVDFDGERVLQLIYQPAGKFLEFPIDLFLAEAEFHCLALERRTVFRLPDGLTEIPILTCEDLILFKVHANRIIDRRDIVSLLMEHRTTMDFAHVRRWLQTAAHRATWATCWKQAFPNDPDPIAAI